MVEGTIDLAGMAIDHARTAKGHQIHLFLLARLKAHSRASGNVQAHAIGCGALESQRAVDLKEMIVAANLHRPAAGMSHKQRCRGPPDLGLDVARHLVSEIFSWSHLLSLC